VLRGARRKLLLALAALAVLALAFQALTWWLARPATEATLARWVAGKLTASLGQPATVEAARLELIPLQLSLRGLRLGPQQAPVLTLDKAVVNLGSFHLGQGELGLNLLYVRGLRVFSASGLPGGGEGSKAAVRVRVRQLVVEEASLDQLQLAPGMRLSLSGVELLVTGRGRGAFSGVFFRATKLELANQQRTLALGVEGWGRLSPGALELRRLLLASEGLEADLRGRASWQDEPLLELAGGLRCQLAEVDRFFGIGIGLAGLVEAQGKAQVRKGGFAVDATVQSQEVTVVGFAVQRVTGSVHVSPEGIEASLDEGWFAGGRVEGSYRLGDFGPTFAHAIALRGQAVDVERFLAALGVPPAGLGAKASVNAELAFEGSAIGEGNGVAQVHLTPSGQGVGVEGELSVSLAADHALFFRARELRLPGGSLRWEGKLALGSWQPSWSLASEGVAVEAVGKLLAGWVGSPVLPPELSGTAVFDLLLTGPFTAPTVVGTVALSPVCLGPLEADALQAELRFSQGLLTLDGGTLALGRGRAQFTASLDVRTPSPTAALVFESRSLPLPRMARWAGLRFPLEGTVSLTGTVAGTLERPRLDARMQLAEVQVVGLPFGAGSGEVTVRDGVLRVQHLVLGGLAGELAVDFPHRHVEVSARVAGLGLEPISPALARLLGGNVEAEVAGEFPWDEPSGKLTLRTAQGAAGSVTLSPNGLVAELQRPGRWELAAQIQQKKRAFSGTASLRVESLRALLADLLGGEQPVDGELEATMEIHLGPTGQPEIRGSLTQGWLAAEGQRVELRQAAPFTLRGSELAIAGLEMAGRGTTLSLEGVRRANGQLSGHVNAVLPASLLGLFWPEAAPRGHVAFSGEISGTVEAPRMEGVLEVSGGSLQIPGLPAPVTAVEGKAELSGETITLRGVRFAFQGGSGRCSGQIRLAPRLELDLALQLAAVRWPLASGFEPTLDGSLRLAGDLSGLQLSGELVLRRSIYQREVNLQRLVLEELTSRERAAATGRGLLAFDVRIAIPGTLEVRTPMARLVAQGELRLVGDSTQPGLLGRLEVFPGGEVELAGVKYEVDRASVSFADPEAIRPVIDLQAHGVVANFTVNVGLSGTLDRLVPNLSSDPPLPEADILALIALGVNPSSAAAAASASAVATSFLTEQLTGAVTQRTRSLLALDQLRIDPFVTTEAGTPTARVTMVKQLSPDWSVTVSTNLSSNREEVILSRWRVGKDVFLEATRDTDGSYSLEVKWRRRY